MKRGILYFIMVVSSVSLLKAQEDTSLDSLLGMSFEDILQIEVVLSTKSAITIQKAPSSIKVYNNQDFEKYGFYTLQDVLNMISGMQVQEYRAGHQNIWVRGVQQRYNNKVILIIDGVPMRDSYYGNFTIDESLPLENVESIEIISGSGSVLYGTNSFAGVISLTTKSEGTSASVRYGSFNTLKVDGEVSIKGLYASGGYFKTDGFSPEYNYDGTTRDHPQDADNAYGTLKYTNKSLSITGSYGSYNYPYKYHSENKDYNFNRKPVSVGARYNLKINEKRGFDFAGYYNYMGFTKDKVKYADIDPLTVKSIKTEYMNSALAGGNVDYSLSLKKHDLLIGLSYQQDKALDIRAHNSYNINEGDISEDNDLITNSNINRTDVAMYVQEMYNINQYILFTAGLRYDVLSDFDNQFNYRLGITGQSETNFYGKILYGTSFRVPSYREYLNVDSYNDDLEPEHLSTFEAQAGKLFQIGDKKGDINITYFYNVYSDFIQELFVDSIVNNDGTVREVDDEMAFNFNKRSTSGMELNVSLYPSKGLFINMGTSYLFKAQEEAGSFPEGIYPSYIDDGTVDITFLSDFTANVLVSYNFLKHFRFGTKILYCKTRSVSGNYQEDILEDYPDVYDPSNADGFIKLDLFACAKIAKKLDLDFKLNNILNSQIYSPPYSSPTKYDIEWTGTTFSIDLRYIIDRQPML